MSAKKLVESKTWKAATETEREELGIFKGLICEPRVLTPDEVKGLGPEDLINAKDAGSLERCVAFKDSDEGRDRDTDRFRTAGWQLGNFKTNPVVPFAHNYHEVPVGRVVKIWKEKPAKSHTGRGTTLKSIKQFATKDESPMADYVFNSIKAGFLKGASVGFDPSEWEQDSPQSGEKSDARVGLRFLTQELIETSVCPVPSNPATLAGAKSLGIDTTPLLEWCEKIIEGELGAGLWVPKSQVEETWKVISPNRKTFILGGADDDILDSQDPPDYKLPKAVQALVVAGVRAALKKALHPATDLDQIGRKNAYANLTGLKTGGVCEWPEFKTYTGETLDVAFPELDDTIKELTTEELIIRFRRIPMDEKQLKTLAEEVDLARGQLSGDILTLVPDAADEDDQAEEIDTMLSDAFSA